jgi:hypothetical protein
MGGLAKHAEDDGMEQVDATGYSSDVNQNGIAERASETIGASVRTSGYQACVGGGFPLSGIARGSSPIPKRQLVDSSYVSPSSKVITPLSYRICTSPRKPGRRTWYRRREPFLDYRGPV